MKFLLATFIASVACLPLLVHSGPPAAYVAQYGFGGLGCGDYLEQRRQADSALSNRAANWFAGYVTAYNNFSPDPQVEVEVLPNGNTLVSYFDKECRDRPLTVVGFHAGTLLGTLRKSSTR